jgi:hypothetical protein
VDAELLHGAVARCRGGGGDLTVLEGSGRGADGLAVARKGAARGEWEETAC